MNDLERLTESASARAARQRQQDRIRQARAAIARDEAALAQAYAARDGYEVRTLTRDLANRREYLAELLGHAPAINWRGK